MSTSRELLALNVIARANSLHALLAEIQSDVSADVQIQGIASNTIKCVVSTTHDRNRTLSMSAKMNKRRRERYKQKKVETRS
jgi:hypothetical protein